MAELNMHRHGEHGSAAEPGAPHEGHERHQGHGKGREVSHESHDGHQGGVHHAHKVTKDGSTQEVGIEEIQPGDRVLVKPGEKVPVDGEVVSPGGPSVSSRRRAFAA